MRDIRGAREDNKQQEMESRVNYPNHQSGGHGIRTRNPVKGTSFPMRPLAIRLPSDSLRNYIYLVKYDKVLFFPEKLIAVQSKSGRGVPCEVFIR